MALQSNEVAMTRWFAASVALTLFGMSAANAQEMTEEQLLQIFREHRESLPDLGSPFADAISTGDIFVPAAKSGIISDPAFEFHIEFPFDSAALPEDQVPRLQQLCQVMDGEGVSRLRIVGHADAKGEEAYNDRLSLLRAEEVERYFVNSCGIDAAMFDAIGLGEHQPLNAADPEGAANRRVELQVQAR